MFCDGTAEPRLFAPVATELLLTPKDTDRDRVLYNKLVKREADRSEAAKRYVCHSFKLRNGLADS